MSPRAKMLRQDWRYRAEVPGMPSNLCLRKVPRLAIAVLFLAATFTAIPAARATAAGSDGGGQTGVEGSGQPAPGDGETIEHRGGSDRPQEVLAITEIMQNPAAVWDSLGEWFEVYNPGADPVDMAGWTIHDDRYNEHVVTGLVVPAGGYVVIGRNADRASNGGVAVDYSTGSDIFLMNGADRLILVDAAGIEVDRVEWDDGATFPDPDGASMSLAGTRLDNAVGSNWCTATSVFGAGDLGTPGRANTCDSGAPLQITEIMQNPRSVSDSVGEWWELYNPTGSAVDLEGWTIRDDDTDSHVIDRSLIIEPGGYLVFGRVADPAVNGGFTPDYVTGNDILLHNNFDELVLVDDRGIRIDRVKWDDGRTFPDPTGASMSLAALGANNAVGSNWCAATTTYGTSDRGTPGAPNNCEPPEQQQPMAWLEITEIMTNPAAVYDNDGEWFELYNREAEPVDINGWTIRDFDTNVHVIDNGGPLVIPAHGYLVLGRSADPAGNGGVEVDYAYGSAMVLYNAADEVVLVDPNGVIVDQVAYDDGRTFPDPEGVSMSLRSLALRNDVGSHWCVADVAYGDGDGGTPGAPNSCGSAEPEAPLVINEIMQNPAEVPDSVGEWFELYNPTDVPVDIDGWTIRDDDFNRHVIDNGRPLIVDPRGYLILGRNGGAANGGVQLDYAYGAGMVLFNADDELVLVDSGFVEVDRVEWDDGKTFPDPTGASMSLTEPDRDNRAGANWCVSGGSYGRGDHGTPGAANECASACDISGIEVTVTASPDTLWPPNGKMHEVTTTVDVVGAEPGTVVSLVGVTTDEEDGNQHGGCPDVVIIDDYTFELRAERNGYGDGRVYTITYEVATACGATAHFSAKVTVVHDQGQVAL
jgi:hypothetical protein